MTDPDKLALMERAGWRVTSGRGHGGQAWDFSFPGKTAMDTRHYPTEEQARKYAGEHFDRAVQLARELLQVVDGGFPVTLDAWEVDKLRAQAASNELTYMGHYGTTGLRRHEVAEMNRWGRLASKLSADGKAWEDIPYRGYAANRFNPERD